MSDIRSRIDKLSPEKRKLLELLAAKDKSEATTGKQAGSSQPVQARLQMEPFAALERGLHPEKSDIRDLYNAVTTQLNATEFSEFTIFLNYGYVSDGSPELSVVELPDNYLNKNVIRLVLELIGDCPVRPTDVVLDVGCGRGGTLSVFIEFFKISKRIGLDLSPRAIEFCNRTFADERSLFVEGDAEELPFPDASVDIVTNVESSHCYPNVDKFFAEVRRVLKPSGYFLYTDVIRTDRIDPYEDMLRNLDFAFIHTRDITRNILLSRDEIAGTHSKAFIFDNDEAVLNRFLAMPGSPLYEDMKTDAQRYMMYQLRLSEPEQAQQPERTGA